MKKLLFSLIAIFLLLASTSVILAHDSIQAILFPVTYKFNNDEKEVDGDYVTLNYNNHTYVPARFVAEHLGARVEYDRADRKVTFNNMNIFEAKTIQVGDTIAGMEVVATDLNKIEDNDFVGTVQFSGSTIVTGTYSYAKSDPLHGEVIRFIIDHESLNRMPIMSHDTRTQSFNFVNITDAKRLFGISDGLEVSTGKAAVVINDFFINYQYKDVFNTAKLNDAYLHSGKSIDSQTAHIETMIEIANVDEVTLLARDNDRDIFQDIVVETKDMSKSFPWTNVTNPTYYPDIHILDVDEDGKDEIVILLSVGYGTDTYVQDIHILNMEDLSEQKIKDPLEAIKSQVTSTITKNNGNVHVLVELNGEKVEQTYNETDAGLWNEKISFGAILKYEVTNGQIIAHVPGGVSPALYAVTAVVEYGPDLQVRQIDLKHQ